MSKSTVRIAGFEWIVTVDGNVARSGDEIFELVSGNIAGEFVVRSSQGEYHFQIQGNASEVRTVLLTARGLATVEVTAERDRILALCRPVATASGPRELRSDIPGIIRRVFLHDGAMIAAGDSIATLEAMKMENEIRSPIAGSLHTLVTEGMKVQSGELLATVTPLEPGEQNPGE